ncbi:unnamed protein product [Adineta steineri]|uniref:Peptidase M14 domain-containing protein n=1 Tax=Adineta steineri TaxID=433720 RepID=A0A814ZTA5_9BILA|nr:unnamed protein product [Adineta steineri]CAF1038071.1 unnamed protein product [Adineta steineri]CAF1247296.1 unnamed protein product [Adineta steineri]CAF1531781.1 unnamed protein product [Adineta steineri]
MQYNLSIILILLFIINTTESYDFHYHNYSQITDLLHTVAVRFPTKTALYEIGKTEGGRSLWALAISAYSPDQHVLLRPEVKYIANMHGNEVVGVELLLSLIEYLITSNDNQVIELINYSRIWIMPSMNPDGLELAQYGDCVTYNGRFTLNGIDLNRNFPDYLGAELTPPFRAKETSAVMSWLNSVPFVLSANFHGGAFIVNIPYDRYYIGKVSTSSDDDIYQVLGQSYANRIRETNKFCNLQFDNVGTVIRGADWYEIIGSMQDYGYLNYGTIELTMEVSCCKYPYDNLLMSYWNYNRNAMIELLFQAQRGVKGLILNENYQPIPLTQVMIDDRRPVVNVTPLGEFWRILLPGTYTLKVFHRGYEIYRQQILIKNIYMPLNLTIIIPQMAYRHYANRPIQLLSPFVTN